MRRPRCSRAFVVGTMVAAASALAGADRLAWADDPRPAPAAHQPPPKPPAEAPGRTMAPSDEAKVLAMVRQHIPELAEILTPLQTTRPAEYRKAIAELWPEVRALAETEAKFPARYPLALDSWRTRVRVELIAAQLAKAPGAERESQLHQAIEARIEADLRRHRFELDQAEAAVSRVREHLARVEANRDRARATLQRAEKGRDAKIDARFRALVPRATPTPPRPTAPQPPLASPTTP